MSSPNNQPLTSLVTHHEDEGTIDQHENCNLGPDQSWITVAVRMKQECICFLYRPDEIRNEIYDPIFALEPWESTKQRSGTFSANT